MAKKKVFVDMDGTLCRFHDETDYLNRMHNEGVFLLDDFNHNLEEAQNLVPVKAVNNINDKGLVGKKWEGYRVHVCSENFYEELKSILNTVPA